MKVAKTADWRDDIPFDTPRIVAEIVPGEPTHCSVCGSGSAVRSRSELWAVKHRHPHHHDGYVRFYCSDHVPRVEPTVRRAAPAAPRTSHSADRSERLPATRRPAASDTVRAMCPDCFIEVNATGVCGNCGKQVA